MKTYRLWIVHLSTLAALVVWAAADPLFESMVRAPASVSGWPRITGLVGCMLLASTSLIGLIVTSFWQRSGHTRHRSIRHLLAITGLIAMWFAFALHHETIAWQGKRVRFANRVNNLETLVDTLRHDWPLRDGELPQVGPFMAYPFGQPTTLILLQSPQLSSQEAYVCAIERCRDGAIKLQLSGVDGGDWVEWHPPHSQPSSFVGGLAQEYRLHDASWLGNGWFLVRYEA